MVFHDYEPKLRKNPLLTATAVILTAGAGGLWIFREKLGLGVPDMLMLTGTALIAVLLTVRDRFRKKENFNTACELKKQREDMKNEDFSDSGIFFR